MFLDSDINGNSWGSFDDDYSNFGNTLTNSIGNIFNRQKKKKKKFQDKIRDKAEILSDKLEVIRNNNYNDGFENNNNNIQVKGLLEKYLSKADSFSQENRSLKLQLAKEERNNKNMMMYGLLGIIAILLITKKK